MTMKMKVPYLSFEHMHGEIRDQMIGSFIEVYDSCWYILGKRVEEFERHYAAFCNTQYCVGVSNGLDALYLSLKALGVGKGDEVIVPSNSYIATLLAVTYTGATPMLTEPDENTFNINPEKITAAVGERTKAIIPIHFFGQACDMEGVMNVAKKYDLAVVEDNAQSHGASFNGKPAGAWGTVNATSFYPGKNLGALGDAGAITTDDPAIARTIRILRNYGSEVKYFNETIGHNMRLDEIQAAFLSRKLEHLDRWTLSRRKIAELYRAGLEGIDDIQLPGQHPLASHVYHAFVIRTNRRNELQQHLSDWGIGTIIHYPIPPHLQNAYSYLGFRKGAFPIAEKMAEMSLSLPLWPGMSDDMIQYVIESIGSFYKK